MNLKTYRKKNPKIKEIPLKKHPSIITGEINPQNKGKSKYKFIPLGVRAKPYG